MASWALCTDAFGTLPLPSSPSVSEFMRHTALWTLAGLSSLVLVGLSGRRLAADARAHQLEADLFVSGDPPQAFTEADLADLPEPAARYLRHAVAPGTPLASACRLQMTGTMTPTPGGRPVDLTASETLAPREGFVWTAQSRMNGLPVEVRDSYHRGAGGVSVTALGFVPIPLGGSAEDVARSSRGRLVAEAVWCPTALVHPDVRWEAVGEDRARYTVTIDGDPVSVTLQVDDDGTPRELTLDRWGDPDGGPARLHPYGFRVEAEGTFGGVTIPTQVVGGWGFGTDAHDPTSVSSFSVTSLDLAAPSL